MTDEKPHYLISSGFDEFGNNLSALDMQNKFLITHPTPQKVILCYSLNNSYFTNSLYINMNVVGGNTPPTVRSMDIISDHHLRGWTISSVM